MRLRLHLHWVLMAGLAALSWQDAGRPGGEAGLLTWSLVFALLWPVVMLAAVHGLPGLAGTLIPREWRASYRRGRPRRAVPRWLRRTVLAAGLWRCLNCRSTAELQIDHFCPWSRGGRSTVWNMFVLCGPCNRVKSDYWVYRRHGRPYYHPFAGHANEIEAAAIYHRERRARRNPLRWLAVAWILAVT